MKICFAIALVISLVSSSSFAESNGDSRVPDSELTTRYPIWHITYDVRPDGSYTETQEWSQEILKDSEIENAKQTSFYFSTSVAKGEVLRAFTTKKSGSRVEAPKNNYQVQVNKGNEGNSPLFSDQTGFTVVFPDVSVGDTVEVAYRVNNTVPMFPGQFSVTNGFSEFVAMDDVRVTINAPASMRVRYDSSMMSAHDPVDKDGIRTWVWEYKNSHPKKWVKAEQSGILHYNETPSLRFSTFSNYGDIAKAYGSRAIPKAVPTARIRALAQSLTTGKSTDKERAKAIYDWVARNITYAGNCIGIGAVVPHDIDAILDNKMGDCKDHATLLQSLLAAVNIESEQMLVNAGDTYDLPNVPVVSTVNHVINYIPSLNLFVDSTSSETPFGMIPTRLGQKPVLPVGNYRDGVTIPPQAQYGHTQYMRTRVKVHEDGSADGAVSLQLHGAPAVSWRASVRPMPKGNEDVFVENLVKFSGYHGKGIIESKDDASELADHYQFGMKVNINDFITSNQAMGITIRPLVGSSLPIAQFLGDVFAPPTSKDIVCSGGKSVEDYEIEFPKSLEVLSIPKASSVNSQFLDYKASYKLEGNKLTVKRELDDKTPTNICSTEIIKSYVKAATEVLKDLKSQVLLKPRDELKYSEN